MTCIIDTKSKRHLPATLAAGLAISAFLVLGAVVAPANAAEQHPGHAGGHGGGHGGGGHGGGRGAVHGHGGGGGRGGGGYGGGGGGYYAPPPVVYGSPYGGDYYGDPYYAPPVIYGPGIGIALPGIGISIF